MGLILILDCWQFTPNKIVKYVFGTFDSRHCLIIGQLFQAQIQQGPSFIRTHLYGEWCLYKTIFHFEHTFKLSLKVFSSNNSLGAEQREWEVFQLVFEEKQSSTAFLENCCPVNQGNLSSENPLRIQFSKVAGLEL